MAYRTALSLVAVGLVILVGCEEHRLPTAPSELVTGIVVYEHADYAGASAHITSDVEDLREIVGPCEHASGDGTGSVSIVEVWDDCISSIRVAPGWGALLYRDDDFDGDRLRVTQDISNLTTAPGDCAKGGFNDCVSSIRLTGAVTPVGAVTGAPVSRDPRPRDRARVRNDHAATVKLFRDSYRAGFDVKRGKLSIVPTKIVNTNLAVHVPFGDEELARELKR